MRYDLLVIGSGPAGQKGAIAAAKLHKRVAIVERRVDAMGGVCLHTGTIPSKTMREAILYLTGYRQREVYADAYRRKRQVTMSELRRKLSQVTEHELDVVQDQLQRNRIDLYSGRARFIGANQVEIASPEGCRTLESDNFLIACGTKPARPSHIPFDGKHIFDSDEFLKLEQIPRSIIVVGAGVIGIEYALMLATLGVQVTVVDGRDRVLDFCDTEIIDTLMYHARSLGIVFRLGEDVVGMQKLPQGMVVVQLESGKRLVSETVLFSVGRVGDTEDLNLNAAGLEPDERGRLWCNEHHQTWVPHIYGVGDVVGFPALASVSMEQGRRAVCHAFGQPFEVSKNLPYGLFTIPEISMVGETEQKLTADCVPYETGIARYKEIARGHIVGDTTGMLKILFNRHTRKVLGVHCIGEAATEIVHIGQAVMALGGTIDYFRDTVFNYPTMAECYKVAAFDGFNKLSYDRLCSTIEEPAAMSHAQNIEPELVSI
jgi:NAD(P) transhydrogenase